MKSKIKFLVYKLAVISMSLFVIVGCSDDDPEPAAKYMLSLRVNPEEKGEVTGAGEYQEGEQVAIDATPVEGFVF